MRLVAAAIAAVALLAAPLAGTLVVAQPSGQRTLVATATAGEDIPADMLALYQQAAAARCPGLPWPVLAAVGKVETDHGRSAAVSSAGALGPMQFLPATWAAYGVDATGDGVADVWDPVDAVHGAGNYLCARGGGYPSTLRDALFAYNPARWYVDLVLEHAAAYAEVARADAPPSLALLDHPNLVLTPRARSDLEAGLVDGRVLALLGLLAEHHEIGVSVLRSGHSKHVAGTARVSLHWCGQAVDVWMVDGQPVSRSHPTARAVAGWLEQLEGPLRPREVGSPFTELHGDGFFTDAMHQGHLHIGYGPRCA